MAKKFARLLEGMSEERLAIIRAEADAMIQETVREENRRARRTTRAAFADRYAVCQAGISDVEKRMGV